MTVGRAACRMRAMQRFKNILIVRLSAAGDVLHAMPAVSAIRRAMPAAKVSWIVEPLSAPLVRAFEPADEVIILDRKTLNRDIKNPLTVLPTAAKTAAFFRGLRKKKFDLAVDFQGNMRSAFVTAASGARVRVGFSPAASREFTHGAYTRQVSARPGMHKVDKDFLLADALGAEGAPERTPLVFPGSAVERMDEIFETAGGPFAVLHPGVSGFGSFKAWPAGNYAGLGDRIAEEASIKIAFTWGPGERETAEKAAAMMEHEAVVAPETRDLAELGCILAHAKVFVGADTGPLHLANFLGTPVVGIYGPKAPAVYGPYFKPGTVVRNEKCDCSPCDLRKCEDPVCMTGIGVEEVAAAALMMLQ